MKMFGMMIVAFTAFTCSACGASVQTAQTAKLIREFPEPVAAAESVSERIVIDGFEASVTPAPVTVLDDDVHTAAEAEAIVARFGFGLTGTEEDVTCERSQLDREAWVCAP